MTFPVRHVLVLFVVAWLWTPQPAAAVVEVLTPLAKFIEDADEIVVVKVQQFDAKRPSAIFAVTDDLKGKTEFRQLAVNLKGKKAEQTEQLIARLTDDLPLVLFITHLPNQDLTYCYTNGTWFQIIGHRDGKQTRWGFTDLEPYLPRTFNGSTDELKTALSGAIAGKQKPPAANPKVKPGIGPAIEKQSGEKPAADR